MNPRSFAAIGLISIAAYLLFFYGASTRGLVSPDEPRYAAVAREMRESGDGITPRLGGKPWFEKPVLLYWLGAAAGWGLPDDRATRLPVALVSVAFLVYFYWQFRRQFGRPAADYGTLILATSAGWVAYSQAGVFDLPLTASLAAALFALLPWVQRPDRESRRGLSVFGALLGLSVLAKGLVGPVLAALALLPVVWNRGLRSVAADLFHPRVLAPFAVVSLPWYLLCYAENGNAFLEDFFWRHHISRYFSDSVQHVQPFWYFVPVLLVGLLPWTPLLALYPSQEARRDERVRFLLSWAITTFLFFSISTNKLPAYILPILPPVAALAGLGVAASKNPRLPLAAAAFLLATLPIAEAVLPRALADGLGKAWSSAAISWPWAVAGLAAAGLVWWATTRGYRSAAVGLLAGVAALGFIHLKISAFPVIDRYAGTRALWREIQPHARETCVGDVRRHVRYGLSYYSADSLPDCSMDPRPYRVESDPAVLVGPISRN